MIIPPKLRRSAVIAGCVTLLGLGGLATAATAVASTTPARVGSHVTAEPYGDCALGHFCIYDGWNGTGNICQWSDRKVSNTVDVCRFIQDGKLVRSVYNLTEHRVQYYTKNNYHDRVGSTLSGGYGNLQGTYQIRSFQPQ